VTLDAALLAIAVFLAAYAALAGLFWGRIVLAERPARRRGMALNLARRAGPPALAGLAVLVAGALLDAGGTLRPAAILAAGGLGYGLHRGLADIGRADWRSVGLRLAVSLGLALGALWLSGLARAAALG
jgi:hypothetical protein